MSNDQLEILVVSIYITVIGTIMWSSIKKNVCWILSRKDKKRKEEERVQIELSKRDFDLLNKAIKNQDKPNPALIKLFKDFEK